ncbi:MAG TPA: CvpA family protein [Clostridia bacterium]
MALAIDGIVIGILLIFTLYGAYKGALKSITSLFGTAISLVIAVLVVYFLGNKVYEIAFINNLFAADNGSLASFFSSKLPDFNGVTIGATQQEINEAIGGLWSVIVPLLTKVISKMTGGAYQGQTINYALGRFLAQVVFYILLALVVFLILRIIIRSLEKLIDKIKGQKTINDIDKFFGLFIGFIKGAVTVSLLLIVFGFILNLSFMAPVKAAFEQTYVAKELSKIVFEIVNKIFNNPKFLGGLTG